MMIALVAALLLATPAGAQDLPKPALTARISPVQAVTRQLVFPSGLRVVLQQDPKAKFVNVATVHTGRREPAGKHGVAHLAEHLSFDATLGGAPVRDRLYAEGVDYDAQYAPDWMMYRSSGPLSALRTILAAQGLRLSDPFAGTTDEHLAIAKQIMGLEKYYLDIGGWGRAWGPLAANLFPTEHPWGDLEPMAWEAEYAGVTLDDVNQWGDALFIAGETTIVVSGPIDFDETISMMFSELPPKAMHPDATAENLKTFLKPGIVNPDPNNPDHVTKWLADPATGELIDLGKDADGDGVPDRLAPRITWEAPEPFPLRKGYDGDVLHIDGLTETPIAVVAWPLPGNWVGQDAMKWMGTTAISNAGYGDWAEQFEIARGPDGGAQAGCSNSIGLRAGMVVCTAVGRDVKVDADTLTNRLRAPGAVFWDPAATYQHEQATEAGRRNTLALTLHALEAHTHLTESMAARTALSTHFLGDPTYTAKFMQEVMSVDKGDVRPWVQHWLPESRAVAVVIDPIPKEKWLSLSPSGTTWHGALVPHNLPKAEVGPTDEQVRAAWAGPSFEGAEEKTLSNGLRVIVLPFGSNPVVTVSLVSRGGSAYERGLDTLNDITMARIWDEIYADPTGLKQEMLPEKIGGEASFNRTNDLSYEGFAVPTDNLDGAFYLLRRNDMARKVKLSGKPNWWKSTRLVLPRAWEARNWWAQQERMKRVLPDHPVAWTMTREDALTLEAASTSELLAYQARKYNPENAALLVVGNVDPQKAFALAETYWGSWKRSHDGVVGELPPRPAPAGPATLFFDADGAQHTVVSASCPLPVPTAENSAAQRVLGSALQEAFGAQLEAAGAKALAGQVNARENGGVAWLDVVTVVPHEGLEATVKAIQSTLALPGDKSLDPVRLQQHKLRTAASEFGRATSSRAMVSAVGEAWMLPYRGKDWFDRWGNAVAAVNLDSLAASADGCAANAVITIEAPAAAFPAMQAAFGAERIDWLALGDAELAAWDKGAYKRKLKQRAKAAE